MIAIMKWQPKKRSSSSSSLREAFGRQILWGCIIFLTVAYILACFLPSLSLSNDTATTTFWFHGGGPFQSYNHNNKLPLGPCAIALYGLPRSFQSLVLPSLITNVIQPNVVNRCDYFVYFHDIDHDPGGRDDRSGRVNAQQVYLLQDAVEMHHTPPFPSVTIGSFTDDDFWKARSSLVQEIHLEKDAQGRPVYIPYNHASYSNTTIENVVKMWHAQEAVWNLLDDAHGEQQQQHSVTNIAKKHYSRIAMLRLDVVYLTPINVYQLANKTMDVSNAVAVIPNFARHPVNDRLMIGPYEAVQVWAAQRIQRLSQHGKFIAKYAPGDGIHSERYLNYTIFPAIRQRGIAIETHPDLCFMRARADESIRFADCGLRHVTNNNLRAVQSLLEHHTCRVNMTHVNRSIVLLECAHENGKDVAPGTTDEHNSGMLTPWQQGCFSDERLPPKQRKKSKPCVSPHVSIFKRHHTANESILVSGISLL